MDAPEGLPIVGPQFYTYEPLPLPLPCQGIFRLMAEMALLHFPFQGFHSESAKRHLTAVPEIGHVTPCPLGVSLTWRVCVSVHIRGHNGCVSVCVCARILYACLYSHAREVKHKGLQGQAEVSVSE